MLVLYLRFRNGCPILCAMETSALENGTPQLAMVRMHLDHLAPVQLDEGYMLRHYTPGDEAGWNALVSESFGRPYDFDATLRADPHFRPERVLFVECNGQLVASAGAWRHPDCGKNTGVIHMVAASPAHRGHHLGYQVSLAALHQMAKEGVNHACLRTDDSRLPAIATYLKLGFLPYLVDQNQAARWDEIYRRLRR